MRGSGNGRRDFPRTARLNRLLQEIIGEELERVDDPRLEQVTITEVSVDADLRHAKVFYDSLAGEEGDEEVLAAFAEARRGLKGAIARQARIKRTPELDFRPDPAVRTGERIEELLREAPPGPADAE
jgi:ribosome-binding factor A